MTRAITLFAAAVSFLLLSACVGSAVQPRADATRPTPEAVAFAQGLGLQLPTTYERARSVLAGRSWQPDAALGPSAAAFGGYPEIACGSGVDAVCSARFSKQGRTIVLVVNQHAADLPVTDAFED
jgi:hypothetical protein